jgi:hypothetical protein
MDVAFLSLMINFTPDMGVPFFSAMKFSSSINCDPESSNNTNEF